MKLGITAALVIMPVVLSDRAKFFPNYNSRKFRTHPLVGKENSTVWAKGKPVVKTVELVAA